ncbi:hypothetical protein C1646_822773 [Rhizophagus diaphanus]|nr:hypothetical protein C1646_822773 [Rhizophagus diaphanus] [Rhizophagus sp. MUCL 43196]
METYEIAFEEKTPLYYKIFEFNEKNYINAQNALEQEIVDYSSDENEEEFEIQLPISLNAYYESFPNFLRGFFDGLIGEIFKKKLINLNKKQKQCEKPLKQLDVEHITKCVTFFASLIISMAFPYLGICGHTDSNEHQIEKQRMDKVNPTERLIKGPNIWNLAVINNIDFKEKSFTYRNIFDTTRKSSHIMLRMAFQMRMPIPLEERADDKKNITSPTGLFGMNDLMKDTWCHPRLPPVDKQFLL